MNAQAEAPRALRIGLVVALVLAIAPLGFAVQYARTYFAERAGLSAEGQMNTMRGVPWFKPEYRTFVRRLSARLPESAGILIEPSALQDPNPGGRTRWFLYLSNDLHPRRVYVHGATWASGTLVDYPEWIRLNLETLDTGAMGGGGLGALLEREDRMAAANAAAVERGVEWKLTFPISTRFRTRDLALYKWADGWQPIDLATFLETGAEVAP